MARVRSNNNGSMVGMVVFGVASFIFLLLSIILYSQTGRYQQEQAAAQSELNQVINAGERGSATLAEVQGREGGGTIVGKLLAEIESLRSQSQGLQGEVQTVSSRLASAEAALQAQTDAAGTAQAGYLEVQKSKADLEAALRTEVDGLSGKVQAISAENQRLNGLIDQQIAGLGSSSERLFAEKQRQMDELGAQVAALTDENSDLKSTVDALRGAVVESPAVTLPDAQIVALNAADQKVFLDIGRGDGLRLGMAFNVFEADDLVKISDPGAQGKAIVEIINVEADKSVGRIVSRNGRARVDVGDVVVNVVYDPNRTFSFHVFGQFDLDFDRKPDIRDRERIEAIVGRSGGQLADALSFDTDYLVLGAEPSFPNKPDDELDLVLMREYRVGLENFQAYQDLLGTAQGLGIPVLNQSRFLDLVGYFER